MQNRVPGEPARVISEQTADRGGHLPSRRELLARLPATALGGAAAALAASAADRAAAGPLEPTRAGRVAQSFQLRLRAAQAEAEVKVPHQTPNRDEETYPNFIGNYSKGLPHDRLGEVDRSAYLALRNALHSGTAAAFERIPLGGSVPLVNPLAGLAFDLEGTDSHQLAIPAFPSVASRRLAAEAVELYWQALCRDVNFTDYGTGSGSDRAGLTRAACTELSALSGFAGPKIGGRVTPQTLFRGFTAADLVGPFVSQLELSPMNYGPYFMNGQMSMYVPGVDYLTDTASWLNVQNGQSPVGHNILDPQRRYIRNGRDYAMFVHNDPLAGLFMSFYNAAILLFEKGAPPNPGNPYRDYRKQCAFGTFGVPFFLGLMGKLATRAFKAVWYAKWFVHRALRPEAYGGLVHWTATGAAEYPVHPDVLDSRAVARVFSRYGSYLLPQAFPEGSPQHPSYAQGHGAMAGACATALKAAVDGGFRYRALPNSITPRGPIDTGSTEIVTASPDGLSLVPYQGPDADSLTLNGEIDKLASNIGLARNFAGIHWRSDYEWGLRLGEAVAIGLLGDQIHNYPGETFTGFEITTFDGEAIVV